MAHLIDLLPYAKGAYLVLDLVLKVGFVCFVTMIWVKMTRSMEAKLSRNASNIEALIGGISWLGKMMIWCACTIVIAIYLFVWAA